MDSSGAVEDAGALLALARERWWFEASERWAGLRSGEVYEGLPWFLQELCPEGFLGRAYAHRASLVRSLPADPRDWSDDQVLRMAAGDPAFDAPGCWLLGDAARENFLRASAPQPIPRGARLARYERLADAASAGELAGSSAGGEQPKFTAYTEGPTGKARAALVKFASLESDAGRRWADLLWCEHLASTLLREHGLRSSETEWLRSERYAFLEVLRFDRHGLRGRAALVSLRSLASLTGVAPDAPWPEAAAALPSSLAPEDARELALRYAFGRAIGNSDMHHGNVSFELHRDGRLELAPTYDMLPMRYAPSARLARPLVFAAETSPFETAAPWALEYWERVGEAAHLDASLRGLATRNAASLRETLRG